MRAQQKITLLPALLFMTFWIRMPAVADSPAVPSIEGEAWVVARDPDLGELTSPQQQPVDFAVWQAKDGAWQLWSCIRGTKCGGKTRLFYRWEGRKITDADWKPMGIAMQADSNKGETPGGLQAPYVCRLEYPLRSAYFMFYGDWVNVCLARSDDGNRFGRWMIKDPSRPALFSEGPEANTRDPMVIRIGDVWHCYYTAHPNRQGAVYCRTSSNLSQWSKPQIVSRGGMGGTGFNSAECPFVLPRNGNYYLFRTQHYGQNAATHVYRSKDPMRFNVDNDHGFVCTLPVAAPEIITHEGRDYIAYLLPTLKGIQIARLAWHPETPRSTAAPGPASAPASRPAVPPTAGPQSMTRSIYLTGFRMGGWGTWETAMRHTDRFAAVAPLCGRVVPLLCGRLWKMPAWVFLTCESDS